MSRVFIHRVYDRYGRDLKWIKTVKVLCSCEDCVRNAVRAAGEALKAK